ncbi:hypothetical protein FALCPG4_000074 [Fusarium falciforme]
MTSRGKKHDVNVADTSELVQVHIRARTYVVIASVSLAYLVQLVAIVGSGLLAHDLELYFGSENEGVWFNQAIGIMVAALNPPLSQAADFWGRKWIVVGCMIFGVIGSIIIARARNMATAIAGFVVIGICFGCQSLLHAIVSEVAPRKHRPVAQGTLNAAAGLGAFLGIAMGGALLRNHVASNYRVHFYVLAGVAFISAMGITTCYNPPPREAQVTLTKTEKLKRLDFVGYLLLAPGLTLFCIALSWSHNPYPWSDSRILSAFVLGMALIIGFTIYEWRFNKVGLLDHRLFKNKNFGLSLITIFAEGLPFFAVNTYFSFQISIFTGKDFFISGMHYAVSFLASLVIAIAVGFYSSWAQSLRVPTIIGFLFMLIFNLVMAATYTSDIGAAYWGLSVLLGAGQGIILPLIMVFAQLSTPPDLISTSSALVITCRAIGGTVGLAVCNAIFTSAMGTEVPHKIAAAVLPLGLPSSSLGLLVEALITQDYAALAKIPGVTTTITDAASDALVSAYGVAFRNCWIASACFCVPALIASTMYRDPKAEFTSHIDAPVEEIVVETQVKLEGTFVPDQKPRGEAREIESV